MGIPGERSKTQDVLEDIITENSPKVEVQCKPQTQETQDIKAKKMTEDKGRKQLHPDISKPQKKQIQRKQLERRYRWEKPW